MSDMWMVNIQILDDKKLKEKWIVRSYCFQVLLTVNQLLLKCASSDLN